MPKIRVKTKEELMKEFGSMNGEPLVPAPCESLQGNTINASNICPKSGDADIGPNYKPLDNCVYVIEKV